MPSVYSASPARLGVSSTKTPYFSTDRTIPVTACPGANAEAFSSQVELATQRYEEAKTAIEELETQLGEASSYFDELGISIYDANGDVKNSMDLMYELIDAYNGIESAAIRNKEMSDLLGKSYNKLKPYFAHYGIDDVYFIVSRGCGINSSYMRSIVRKYLG